MNPELPFLKKSHLVLISCALIFILGFKAFSQTNPGDFVNSISINQELKVPVRAAIDTTGNIYVTDASQKCIVQYDALWNYVGKIYVGEDPTSIAISDNNTMFVGDYHNGIIYKRLPNGTTSIIYNGTLFPSSMVVSPINELYVVDSRSKKVLVMDFAGNVVRTFGSGIFLFPTGIAFDRKNNRVIVSEHGGFGDGFNLHTEIRIFGTSGNLISTFGGWGNSPGKFYRIQGLTVGRCGNIYVTDPYQGNISVFNGNGTYITKFGIWGDTLGELNVPMDVIFDSHERVYVVSLNNSALEVFNITDLLPSSNIETSSVSICEGNTTPVKISFTGTAPWTFTYTINGANPQTITSTYNNPYILNASISGAYNVTALSDASHTGTCFSNTANVILNPLPTSNITNINPDICQGESAIIPVTFTGNAPWTFTYTINGINPTTVYDVYTNPNNINATQAGTYQITALSGNNCEGTIFTGSATVSLNPEPVSTILTPATDLCVGASANVLIDLTGTAPWSLTYISDGQNPVTYTNITTSPFSLTVFNPGTYQIIALSDANCNGSTFNGTAVITEHLLPVSNFISENSTICANDSAAITIALTGSPPWSLTYTIDGLNPSEVNEINSSPYTFHTQQQGIYEVISLSDDYCNGMSFLGSNAVTVNPLPVVDLGPDVIICSGQTVTLDGGIHDSYLWSDSSTNQTLTVSASGNYSLLATDLDCQNLDEVFVNVSPNPMSAFIYNADNLEVTFTNNSSNANSYLWDFGDGFTDTSPNPVHQYLVADVYTVTLTASSISCGASTFINTVNLITTSVDDKNPALSFAIYPNPTHGIFTLDIFNPNSSKLKISIFNSIGQIVYEKELNSAESSEQINLSHLSSGVYTIRLDSKDILKFGKLILTD